jgi:hypothetical protein
MVRDGTKQLGSLRRKVDIAIVTEKKSPIKRMFVRISRPELDRLLAV